MLWKALGRFIGRRTKVLDESSQQTVTHPNDTPQGLLQEHAVSGKQLTGKTKGIPPRTDFDPSRRALELTNKFSLPSAVFHERTVAPKRRTSIDSPVGKLAVTRELSSEMETCGVGMVGETGMAEGFLERSMSRSKVLILECT